jgi:hypothetical protein
LHDTYKIKAFTEGIYPNLLGLCLYVTLFGYVYRILLPFLPIAAFFVDVVDDSMSLNGSFGERRVCNVRWIRFQSGFSREGGVIA